MKTLSASLTVAFMLLFSLSFHQQANAQKDTKAEEASRQQAQQVWEQAIAAKGGRERLYAVRNLLVSSGYRYKSKILGREVKTRFEDFYAFPSKMWRWSDERPTVFGLFVEIWNYERNLNYLTYPNDPKSPRQSEPAPLTDSYIAQAQLFYLMETRWQKPQPLSVEASLLHNKPVDIVHTLVNGKKVDFVLDHNTHLLMQIVDYSPTGKRYTDLATEFSDYVEVNGIQMPQKELYFEKIHLEVSYQINVEYDEQIFERPPTIEAGPEAWKRRKAEK